MSRIGRLPVKVPIKVIVGIDKNVISIKGPKGELSMPLLNNVSIDHTDEVITFTPSDSSPKTNKLHGTYRACVANMIKGVTEGFEKKLELKGVGYRAKATGKHLELTLGFSHPVSYQIPEEVEVETPSNTEIVLKSFNKQILGQAAAEIRAFRPPEPYKGKGVRYSDEVVRRKEAKKAAGA